MVKPMYLCRLVYFSSANGPQDIGGILTSAKLNNKQKQITGALWFDGNFFVQVLEGDRTRISETFQRISGDSRHANVVMSEFGAIDERIFPHWNMAYYADVQENRARIIKYTSEERFDPRTMPAQSLIKMMTDSELVKKLA